MALIAVDLEGGGFADAHLQGGYRARVGDAPRKDTGPSLSLTNPAAHSKMTGSRKVVHWLCNALAWEMTRETMLQPSRSRE